MIIKGQARGRAKQLAAHLLRADENESIHLYECRGTLAQDVEGALVEMEARGMASRTRQPLYHASISPEASTPLSDTQIRQAVDVLEEKLGLHGLPRIVVLHRKKARDHVHVVWCRVDAETGTAVHMSWNYRLHEQAARQLERQFGHRRLESSQLAWVRSGSRRTVKDHELRQGERSGIARSTVSRDITALWFAARNGAEFRRKLEEAGYTLARGDRRALVVVDRAGAVHSLVRRVDGVNTSTVRDKLRDISLNDLPSVCAARESIVSVARSAIPRKFVSAAREITEPGFRSPIYATAVRSRQNLKQMLAPNPTARSLAVVVTRNCLRFGPARQNVNYRSTRAALIGEYASRIAEAIRYARRDELDAILARLFDERAAAIAALGEVHGHKRGRHRASRRTRQKTYRLRRTFRIR